MTKENITDGRRIAELLASELTARRDGPLASLELIDVDTSLDSDVFGALAYGVVDDETRLADIYVHDDRVRIEFLVGLDSVPEVGEKAGLRVRPKAVDPPRVLVFVESGAEVKRALGVVEAAIDSIHG